MTHEQKVKLARKMITPKELKKRVSIWNSMQWNIRRNARLRKHSGITTQSKKLPDSFFRKLFK